MRANLCVYRELDDPWLKQFRDAPRETLQALMPGLAKITGAYDVPGRVQIRPADLYVTEGVEQAGCRARSAMRSRPHARRPAPAPARCSPTSSGSCNVYIPRWLATPGMGADKIAAFYADPVRAAYHAQSAHKAFLIRSVTIDTGLAWEARRWAGFLKRAAIGLLRELGRRVKRSEPTFGAGTTSRALARSTTRR